MGEETKKERREAARQARIEAQVKRAKARKRKQLMVWVLVVIVVAGGAGFLIVNRKVSQAKVETLAEEAGCTAKLKHDDQGAEHISQGIPHEPYNSNPPSTGPHYGNPAEWGVYEDPQPAEQLVHNLEHGGIVIHYRDLEDGDVDVLQKLVESYPDRGTGSGVILNPNPDIDKPVAFAAWRNTRSCDRVEIDVAKGFINEFCGKGPEKFALGCT